MPILYSSFKPRKKQIDLVERFVKGFVTLSPMAQARAVEALAGRVRLARRGWAERGRASRRAEEARGVGPMPYCFIDQNAYIYMMSIY